MPAFSSNEEWGIKDFKLVWFYCPPNCINCPSSTSCTSCQTDKCYIASKNSCLAPYTTTHQEPCDGTTCKPINFSSNPKRIILGFVNKLDITTCDSTYITTTVKTGTKTWTKRNVQDYKGVILKRNRILSNNNNLVQTSWNYDVIYRADNMIEIHLVDLVSYEKKEVTVSFTNPIPDSNLAKGFVINNFKLTILPNVFKTSIFYDIQKDINALRDNLVQWLLLAFSWLFFKSYGANWLFLQTCQKIHIIFFIGVSYYGDLEQLSKLCQFSMLSFYQKVFRLFVLNQEYYKKLIYDSYFTSSTGNSLDLKFSDNIPPNKMPRLLVRMNFLINLDIFIAIFLFIWLVYGIVRLIYCVFVKCFQTKENCINRQKGFIDIVEFPFIIRIMLATYIPVMFYGASQIKAMNFSEPLGMISCIVAFQFMGVYNIFIIHYNMLRYVDFVSLSHIDRNSPGK